MTTHFDRAFNDLLESEGGFTIDKGGKTRFGITEAVARQHGYTGDMRDLPVLTAKHIYRTYYWHPLYGQLTYAVAYQLFDAAVNSGPKMSAKWLQRSIGVHGDGVIGPVTTETAILFDPLKLILAFNAHRLEFMAGLSNWPEAGRGWARRIARNMKMGAG